MDPLNKLCQQMTIGGDEDDHEDDHEEYEDDLVRAVDVYGETAVKSIDTLPQVQPLLDAIRQCKDIEELHLEGFSFGTTAAEHLGNLLAECGANIKHAFWSDIFVSRTKEEVPIALRSLMSGLMKAGAKLYTLDLSNNAFGAQGVQSLVEYFKSDLSCNLEELNLTNTGLGIGGAKVLSSALTHVKSCLKAIRIGRNRLENEGSIALAQVFKRFSTIEVLEMPQNGIYHKGVEALVEALEVNLNLKDFVFSDNTVTPKGALALKRVLPKLQALERLLLDDCLLKNAGALHILEALGQPNATMLMELNLSSNELTDKITELAIENAIFWRANFQLILCDNTFGKSFKDFLLSRAANCEDCEVILGDEDDLDEDYEDEDEDEDVDVGDDDDEDEEEDDASQATSDPDEDVIPTTINQSVLAPCKEFDEVITFLNDTSKESFLKLGTNPMDTLIKHLQQIKDEDEYSDELVQMIFKMNIVDQDPKELFSRMKVWEEENSYRAFILANAFLVHLGLMKPEDKKKKLCGNSDNCVRSFAKTLKSPEFSARLRDLIMFVVRDKCSKEKKIGNIESGRFLELLTS